MAWHKSLLIHIVVALVGMSLVACQKRIPEDALALSRESLKDRQLQTSVMST